MPRSLRSLPTRDRRTLRQLWSAIRKAQRPAPIAPKSNRVACILVTL